MPYFSKVASLYDECPFFEISPKRCDTKQGLTYMVAYSCYHLSDNYFDLSDLYDDLSFMYVDLSDHYVGLSEKYHHN